jgi:hypothetical protein
MRRSWLAVALLVGCSASPERSLLEQFFADSRLRDRTALSAYATVVFEPLQDGIVTTFEVLDISPVPVSSSDGRIARKVVTVEAPVKLPDGQVVDRTLRVTLEWRNERWMVTGVTR